MSKTSSSPYRLRYFVSPLILTLALCVVPRASQAEKTEPPSAQSVGETNEAQRSPKYGGTIFDSEATGISVGFNRWLGDLGTQYGDCIGAIMMVAVEDPWADNHLLFGAVFNTAVGQYGNGDDANIFAAAATVASSTSSDRTVGPTAALPPLPFSYSSLSARAAYRLRTESVFSAEVTFELGYGLLGLPEDAQANPFAALGANVVVKIFPTLIMTLGLQYRQDLGLTQRIEGYGNLSTLAIFNSFELVKF